MGREDAVATNPGRPFSKDYDWGGSLSSELLQEISRHAGSHSWGALRCVCQNWRRGISLAVRTVRLTVPDSRAAPAAGQPVAEAAAAAEAQPRAARRGAAAGRPAGRCGPAATAAAPAATAAAILGPQQQQQQQEQGVPASVAAGNRRHILAAAVPAFPPEVTPAVKDSHRQTAFSHQLADKNNDHKQQHQQQQQQQPTTTAGRGFAASSGRPPPQPQAHTTDPNASTAALPPQAAAISAGATAAEPAAGGDASFGRPLAAAPCAPSLPYIERQQQQQQQPQFDSLAFVFNLHRQSTVAAVAAATAAASAAAAAARLQGEASDSQAAGVASSVGSSSVVVWSFLEAADKLAAAFPSYENLSLNFAEPLPLAAGGGGGGGGGTGGVGSAPWLELEMRTALQQLLSSRLVSLSLSGHMPYPLFMAPPPPSPLPLLPPLQTPPPGPVSGSASTAALHFPKQQCAAASHDPASLDPPQPVPPLPPYTGAAAAPFPAQEHHRLRRSSKRSSSAAAADPAAAALEADLEMVGDAVGQAAAADVAVGGRACRVPLAGGTYAPQVCTDGFGAKPAASGGAGELQVLPPYGSIRCDVLVPRCSPGRKDSRSRHQARLQQPWQVASSGPEGITVADALRLLKGREDEDGDDDGAAAVTGRKPQRGMCRCSSGAAGAGDASSRRRRRPSTEAAEMPLGTTEIRRVPYLGVDDGGQALLDPFEPLSYRYGREMTATATAVEAVAQIAVRSGSCLGGDASTAAEVVTATAAKQPVTGTRRRGSYGSAPSHGSLGPRRCDGAGAGGSGGSDADRDWRRRRHQAAEQDPGQQQERYTDVSGAAAVGDTVPQRGGSGVPNTPGPADGGGSFEGGYDSEKGPGAAWVDCGSAGGEEPMDVSEPGRGPVEQPPAQEAYGSAANSGGGGGGTSTPARTSGLLGTGSTRADGGTQHLTGHQPCQQQADTAVEVGGAVAMTVLEAAAAGTGTADATMHEDNSAVENGSGGSADGYNGGGGGSDGNGSHLHRADGSGCTANAVQAHIAAAGSDGHANHATMCQTRLATETAAAAGGAAGAAAGGGGSGRSSNPVAIEQLAAVAGAAAPFRQGHLTASVAAPSWAAGGTGGRMASGTAPTAAAVQSRPATSPSAAALAAITRHRPFAGGAGAVQLPAAATTAAAAAPAPVVGAAHAPPMLSKLSQLVSLTLTADLGFPSPQHLEAITALKRLQRFDMRGAKFMQVEGDASLVARQACLHVSNEHVAVVARCTFLTSLALNHLQSVGGQQLAALTALNRLTCLTLTDALSGNTVQGPHLRALAEGLPELRSLDIGRVTCPPLHLPPPPLSTLTQQQQQTACQAPMLVAAAAAAAHGAGSSRQPPLPPPPPPPLTVSLQPPPPPPPGGGPGGSGIAGRTRSTSPSANLSYLQPWGPVLGLFHGLTSLHLQVACSFETELLSGAAALPLLEHFSMELLDVPPPQLAAMLEVLAAPGPQPVDDSHGRRGDSGSPPAIAAAPPPQQQQPHRHGRRGGSSAPAAGKPAVGVPAAAAMTAAAAAAAAADVRGPYLGLSRVLRGLTLTACMLYDEHLELVGRLGSLRCIRLDQVDVRTRDPDGWTALSGAHALEVFSFRVWNNPVLSASNLCVLTNDSLAMMAANWPRLQQLTYCGKVALTEKAEEHLTRMSALISLDILGTDGTSLRVWRSAATGQFLRSVTLPYTAAAKVSSRNGYVTYSDSDDSAMSEGSEASVNWMGEIGYVTSEYDAD